MLKSKEAGVKEMITSLAVLCMVSLLLALLSLVFLLKVSPVREEKLIEYQVQCVATLEKVLIKVFYAK